MVIILNMNQLDQIENRIKEIIEKGSDLLPWADQGSILVSHFCESLRQFLLEDINCLKKSPARIQVIMSSEEVRLWQKQVNWQTILMDAFVETVVELNCKPLLLPEIDLTARNSLQNGQIIFSVDETSTEKENTGIVSLSKPIKTSGQKTKPDTGRVLINLDKTIPVDKPVLNLGRRNTNDIVVNDLRVSRVHAQLRKTRSGYMIFDIDSTGGTFVNGERITSRLLKSGDVISLAGYTLIFTNEKDHDHETEREITADLTNQTIVEEK